MTEEISQDFESLGLCPHGQLPGLCTICNGTDEGKAKTEEIRGEAKSIGSEIARQLEEETGIKPYDVTMVLGAGFRPKREPKEVNADGDPIDPATYKEGWMFNIESKMRLNAAAQLYFEGRTRIICLTGGSSPSEKYKDHSSLAELGKKYLIEKWGVPEEDIILEGVSDATHSNLAYGLREIYKQHLPVGSMAVISTNYHLNRARKMAEMSNINVDLIPAESMLLAKSPHYRKFVMGWLMRAQNKGMEEAEIKKLSDPEYWEDRAAVFTTPLNEDVPPVDLSKSVAKTAGILKKAGETGIQTDAF